MPSPFPGMDPYLEGSLWGSVHHQLIAEIARQLVPLLRPRYLALCQERFVHSGFEKIPQSHIEIRDRATRKLVTVLTVLIPANKRAGTREEYLDMRSMCLSNRTHLIEIDLLRVGQRLPSPEALSSAEYFIFVHCWWKQSVFRWWGISLDGPLPTIQVPLVEPDEQVSLDLQAAITNVYELCGLALAVDYSALPEMELDEQQTGWARGILETQAIGQVI